MTATVRKPRAPRPRAAASADRRPQSRRRPDPRVVIRVGPFAGGPERVITLKRPATIAEVIRREKLAFRLPTVAVMASKGDALPIMRKDWTTRKIRRGEVLTFVAVPGKGGSGGTKQIVALVATIALAIAAPFAGAGIAGALGFTGALAAKIFSAAVLVGGSLLLNAILPHTTATPGEGETVYTASASANRIMPLEPVPVLDGRLRYPPPLGSRPYSEFDGNDQLLFQLHALTCGDGDVEKWEIGDTTVWTLADGFSESFTDVEMEIVHPGDSITLFPPNVVVSDTVSGQTVPDPPDSLGGFVVNQAGTTINMIAVDLVFPGGLYSNGSSGGVNSASRQILAEYREIDDDGDPLGGWSVLFNETFDLKTRTPQRFTRKGDVPDGRYEVRLSSSDADETDDGDTVNRVLWVGLRGYLPNFQTPANVLLIATKIRANDQLSQASASEYFFTVQRKLPIYNAGTETWSAPQATSSIAWAVADLLRNADYGLGLDDSLFDLDWLVAYDTVWGARGDEFNAIFDRKWVAQEALNAILRCGRAQSVRVGGKIGFVRDEPKLLKRATFTSRNIVAGSFSRRFVLFDDESPDHVVASYLDRDVWKQREVSAVISAVGDAEPQERDYFGITDRDHAWREAIYDAASNAYRREFATFQVEWEGKLLVRGDPILIHGPLYHGVHQAALTDRTGDTFDIDRDFTAEVGTNYYVILRGRDGREWGPCLIQSFPDERTFVLGASNRLVAEAAYGDLDDILPIEGEEAAHVLICEEQTRPFDGLLVSASPESPHRVTVMAVKDDQRVHLADETEIIPAPYTPQSLFQTAPEAPSIVGLYAVARNGTLHIELEAGWQPAAGAERYVAEISYDDGAAGNPAASAWTPVHDGVGTRFTAVILPQDWTLRVAAIGVRQGVWSYIAGTSPAPLLPPLIVTQAALSDILSAFIENVRQSIPADLLTVRADLDLLSSALNSQVSTIREQQGRINIGVGERYAQNLASAELALTAAADANSAIAALFVDLFAVAGESEAQGLIRFIAAALPEGAAASFAVEVRASFGDEFESAGFYIDVGAFEEGATSRIRLVADQVHVEVGGVTLPLELLQIGDPVYTPIVGGEVQVDLSKHRQVYFTELSANAEMQFPLGAQMGTSWTHLFKQYGGFSVTFDLSSLMVGDTPPTMPSTAGYYVEFACRVLQIVPIPIASVTLFNQGTFNLTSNRRFAISPAVLGRTIWDLDAHGPCTVTSSSTITPLGTYLDVSMQLWGPGGSSGSTAGNNAAAGSASTFQGLTANPGGPSLGRVSPGFTVAGVGGTATGGDTNETAENGENGGSGNNFAGGGYGGAGAGTGGGARTASHSSTFLGAGEAGATGNAPGGGAQGPYQMNFFVDEGGVGIGGAGGGGKTTKAFGAGVLLNGVPYSLVLGAPGATANDGGVGGAARAILT